MISVERISWLAQKSGIKIDAFGSPVVDRFEYLVNFVRLIEGEATQTPVVKTTPTVPSVPDVKVRAKAGPKPGWKQRKAAELAAQEAAKNVG
jgi:hypothetical protein